MSTSSLISDYMGKGLAAARPTSPNIPSGAIAFYYETDTSNTFCWTGSAWVQVNGGGAAPTIVQTAAAAFSSGANSVTFGSTPTSGNLLIAFVNNGSIPVASSGWTIFGLLNGGGVDYANALYKVAGASESTTQTPITNTGNGGSSVFEIHTGAASFVNIVDVSSSSSNFNTLAPRNGGILIGALHNNSTADLPTSITGATAGTTGTAASRSTALFSNLAPAAGANNIAYTYGASHDVKCFGCCCF